MLRRSIALSVVALALVAPAANAAGGTKTCRRACGDTTAPLVAFSSPAGGSTVSGTVTLSGTASDGAGLAAVDVAVDGGSWLRATGTNSWTYALSTAGYANGTHTLYARATDTSQNMTVKTITVTVSNGSADTTAPAVAIAAPTAGATVSGTTTVTGSASDNASVARVDVSVDGGAWQAASGTSSWSLPLNTGGYANGGHTVTARATDTAGNVRTTAETVTVSNATADTTLPSVAISSPASGATVSGTVTVSGTASDNASLSRVDVSVDGGAWALASGTSSWSLSLASASYGNGSHTISARATDGAGNTRTASVTVTVSNSTTGQHWVSPEGATIDIDSAGGWTVSQVYQMLKDSSAAPGDFARVAPTLTVKVQDTYASQTVTSATTSNGTYTSFSATVYLKGVSSTFATQPDAQLAHEYGHAWTNFHLYLDRNGVWSSYLDARNLTGNPNLDTSYTWDRGEIIAEDYRLLFGSSLAISERPQHMNTSIPDPRNVAGLRDFLLTHWAA